MNKTIVFLVTGRVQGVFFRAQTKSRADEYGISGWVKNRPDGRVEGRASGDADALQRFTGWLEHGPQMARVERVEIQEAEPELFDGFSIR
jgi:acylphosphatase